MLCQYNSGSGPQPGPRHGRRGAPLRRGAEGRIAGPSRSKARGGEQFRDGGRRRNGHDEREHMCLYCHINGNGNTVFNSALFSCPSGFFFLNQIIITPSEKPACGRTGQGRKSSIITSILFLLLFCFFLFRKSQHPAKKPLRLFYIGAIL